MKKLSRREIFRLVGGAAAAAALPLPALVALEEPAVGGWMAETSYSAGAEVWVDWDKGRIVTMICPACGKDVIPTSGHHCGYVHWIPYWQVAPDHIGLYMGIERTRKP